MATCLKGAAMRFISAVRGIATVLLFVFFGIGTLLLAPFMLVLRTPDRCHPPIRFTWRLLILACRALGLIGIDAKALEHCRGCIVAANHPTLIDVVMITALIPRTLFVAKHGLLNIPVLSTAVRRAALPDDARLLTVAEPYLASGWNVLVFPEGTRSKTLNEIGPLRRGVAQLALRTGAPIFCIGIHLTRMILGKGQRITDMGVARAVFTFRSDSPRKAQLNPSIPLRSQASALSDDIRKRLESLIREPR